MLNKLKIIAAIACLSTLLSSCLRDGMEECRVYLQFIYDLNMEYSDSFAASVNTVDLFVFDENEVFLYSKKFTKDQLLGGNKVDFGRELHYGIYKIFTIGGLSDSFEITDENGNPCSPGNTTLDEIRVSLERHSRIISHEFSSLWVGETVTIDNHAAMITYPVHLTKDTNHFNLQLTQSENSNNTDQVIDYIDGPEVLYNFEIVSPEGAVYSWENRPVLRETIIYTPYELLPGTEHNSISKGQINTCRLFNIDQYRLIVRNTQTQQIEWNYDLVKLLIHSKPDKRPDGSTLPIQEYLDRESEWEIVVQYREEQGFVAVSVQINGWILWLHNIEA